MDELDRFKSEINRTAFAAGLGYRLDRREISRCSAVMRHPVTDENFVFSRDEHDGHWIYFSVRDAHDNGTIVDFLQRRGHRTILEVSRELRSWIPGAATDVATGLRRADVTPRAVDRVAAAKAFAVARVVSIGVYLNRRGIRPDTLALERFAGTFREDALRNVLFPHRDADGFVGYESKNHGWTSFSPGGVKALWQSRSFETDTKLVIAEGAIDALTFHARALCQHCRLDRRASARPNRPDSGATAPRLRRRSGVRSRHGRGEARRGGAGH